MQVYYFRISLLIEAPSETTPTSCFPPPGPPHANEAEHHVGEVGSEVRRPSSLWAGRFTQHRQDSSAHAAGWVSAARQRTHPRRPAALRSQLGSCGRSSCTSQPPQQGLDLGAPYPYELQKRKKIQSTFMVFMSSCNVLFWSIKAVGGEEYKWGQHFDLSFISEGSSQTTTPFIFTPDV